MRKNEQQKRLVQNDKYLYKQSENLFYISTIEVF